jgi:phospholipase C
MNKLVGVGIAVLFIACAGPSSHIFSDVTQGGARGSQARRPAMGSNPIQHVVVIVQENRSFDNLFHAFPGANSALFGWGHGKKYVLQPLPLQWRRPMRHDHPQFLENYDGGQIDGFDDRIRTFRTGSGCQDPINHPSCWVFWSGRSNKKMAYSYVIQSQIKPYWIMASQYALGDDAFASNNGPSFPSHQYLIAAQSGHASEVPSGVPWGCDAPPSVTVDVLQFGQAYPPVFSMATGHETPGPFPCFTYATIADLLDAAQVSWHYYVAKWPSQPALLNAFDAIQSVRYGPDWQNIRSPDTSIFADIANGTLPGVSWVMPTGPKSDHAGPDSGSHGPQWVASVVNAIGETRYWENTAIIVMWDEWGGWYDHVVPPQYPDPQTGAYEGLGFRVPLIVVSAYAKAHYVSHQQHEIASTLHFIEETFGLPSLGGADARADAFDDMFDFTQAPLRFQPIPTKFNADYFIEHPSTAPGDDD